MTSIFAPSRFALGRFALDGLLRVVLLLSTWVFRPLNEVVLPPIDDGRMHDIPPDLAEAKLGFYNCASSEARAYEN